MGLVVSAQKKIVFDRRRAPRRIVHEKCAVLVEAAEVGDRTPIDSINGSVIDVNEFGIGLITNGSVPIGLRVKITVYANRAEQVFKAEVRWCAPLPISGRILKPTEQEEEPFRLGLQFIAEDDEEKNMLKELTSSM